MQPASEPNWLESALSRAAQARIAVIGDFCVDAYWYLDDEKPAPTSLETGLPIQCVRRQTYGLGGAGNVVANLIDLGVNHVRAIGMIGPDPWGTELMRLLRARGADVSGMLAGDADWQTTVYAKPYSGEVEQSRFDFGGFNRLSHEGLTALVTQLRAAAAVCDVVVINQQFQSGLGEEAVVARLNRVIAESPKTRFIVDSRDAAALFRGAILKLNAVEAARLVGCTEIASRGNDPEAVQRHALKLAAQTGQPVFVTRGERGIVVADGAKVTELPGIQVIDRTDPVGAGDTVVAAVAAAVGSGSDPVTAAALANIAASITVRKLRTTGTATPAEILSVGPAPDFIYAPDLADDPRAARCVQGTEIELVRDLPENIRIRHAIFDHDGTLSTLRQGWGKIMEAVMVRAVLGPR
jgi:rfaE bifunctional protein kinase chain/domain